MLLEAPILCAGCCGRVHCGKGLPCKGPFRGGGKMGESTGERSGKHQQFKGGEF